MILQEFPQAFVEAIRRPSDAQSDNSICPSENKSISKATVLYCTVLYCTVLYCVVLCYVVLCCVVFHCVMLRCVVLCYVMLRYVMLRCVMLCYVALCCVVSCRVVLCYVMLCCIMLRLRYIVSYYVSCDAEMYRMIFDTTLLNRMTGNLFFLTSRFFHG